MAAIRESVPLTVARLKELLDYEPETGVFRWLKKPSPKTRVQPGDVAGSVGVRGYRHIKIDGVRYFAHRLAFMWMTGKVPSIVDHIKRVTDDQRWCNLREVTWSESNKNRAFHWPTFRPGQIRAYPSGNKFTSTFRSNYLGTFDTPGEAHAAYLTAARKAYGEFARAS